ncbi:MAG: hypothetical protein EAZ30_01755 [Betaproteobacteria bacterium]|nr:MAG: hypothetical protein EAZ30_01755 [Betaproteobacteria bacterium]
MRRCWVAALLCVTVIAGIVTSIYAQGWALLPTLIAAVVLLFAWRESPRHQQHAVECARELLSELATSHVAKAQPDSTPMLAFVTPMLMVLRERTGRHFVVFRDELEGGTWRNLSAALRLQRAR